MTFPGIINHTAQGIAELPERLRQSRISKYLSVYLQEFDILEFIYLEAIDTFLLWEVPGQTRDFVLETIGELLGQPRPGGFDNDKWAFAIRARSVARRSSATQDDVLKVANFLAAPQNAGVSFIRLKPKIAIIIFTELNVTKEEESIYADILLSAVDAVDELGVGFIHDTVALFDVDLFDIGLFGP